jgi:putative FmdB family regulatory protein
VLGEELVFGSAPEPRVAACRNYTLVVVPLYEFKCRSCGHRFEELVGHHAADSDAVKCPECEAESPQRLISSYAPINRQLTSNQKKRMEDKRGTNRGGAMQRFKQQRQAERRGGRRGG